MSETSDVDRLNAILENADSLGSRTLPDGTRLVGRLPHVGPDAWLHLIFAGLRDMEISEVEARAGRALPQDYRLCLKRHNGLSLFSGALYIAGLRLNYIRSGDTVWQPFAIEDANIIERPSDATFDCLFVGGYKSDGSRLYLMPGMSSVFRCRRDSITPLNTWPNLDSMLTAEATRLRDLFDELGRRIDARRSTAPDPDGH